MPRKKHSRESCQDATEQLTSSFKGLKTSPNSDNTAKANVKRTRNSQRIKSHSRQPSILPTLDKETASPPAETQIKGKGKKHTRQASQSLPTTDTSSPTPTKERVSLSRSSSTLKDTAPTQKVVPSNRKNKRTAPATTLPRKTWNRRNKPKPVVGTSTGCPSQTRNAEELGDNASQPTAPAYPTHPLRASSLKTVLPHQCQNSVGSTGSPSQDAIIITEADYNPVDYPWVRGTPETIQPEAGYQLPYMSVQEHVARFENIIIAVVDRSEFVVDSYEAAVRCWREAQGPVPVNNPWGVEYWERRHETKEDAIVNFVADYNIMVDQIMEALAHMIVVGVHTPDATVVNIWESLAIILQGGVEYELAYSSFRRARSWQKVLTGSFDDNMRLWRGVELECTSGTMPYIGELKLFFRHILTHLQAFPDVFPVLSV